MFTRTITRQNKREIKMYCSNDDCGKPIYEGDEYFPIDGDAVCLDCIEKTPNREILEGWLRIKFETA